MKKIVLIMIICAGVGFGQNMETYCCVPPSLVTIAKPNILFMLQMSASMWQRASCTYNDGDYDPAYPYYGYFDETVNYYYSNSMFYKDGHQPGGAVGPFPGSILNWAVSSRADVMRKVIAGGKGQPAQAWPKNMLEAQGEGPGWPCHLVVRVAGTVYKYEFTKPQIYQVQVASYMGEVSAPDTADLNAVLPTGTFFTNISIPAGDPAGMGGLLREISDKDWDGAFDEDAPRLALQYYGKPAANFVIDRLFWESDGPMSVSAEAFMTDVNNQIPDDVSLGDLSNVGKAIFDAMCYFSYVKPAYDAFVCKGRIHLTDPYCTGSGITLQPVWCRKSFVIVIGDGESVDDDPVINTYPFLPAGPFARVMYDYDNDGNPADQSTHPGDDYAYYGHITDLRPDLFSTQNATFYSVMCFGDQHELFMEIAKDGGFDDIDDDNIPDPEEYDTDGDGVPDNYYAAKNGYEIEDAIMQIVLDIMAKISSGSAVSVVTTGSKIGGITTQAQFYPRKKIIGTTDPLQWIGTCQGLWLDPFGWLREDNVPDHVLNLQQDYVISMQWNMLRGNVMVTRFRDNDGSGDPAQFDSVTTVPIEYLEPVWDGGNWLWQEPAASRNVFTFVDADQNGQVSPGETHEFTISNAAILRPYLGVATDAAADTVIEYIRGTDYAGLRSRTAGTDVWKLGDIINAGAIGVQPAIERYDFIYGDQSYIAYYEQCQTRRQAVYVGANDGMLHCFNSGIPTPLQEDPVVPMMLDPAGYDLGEELWAYVPFNLLPHLKWLQDPSYCHVYYADQRTYVTDARIFADDLVHPNGWGTLLIGGMRLGGMTIVNAVDTCRSAYFALDVTDPENPAVLWEFTHPDLGLTVCYSCVIKVKDSWYLVFGSGPQTCGGESTKNARIFCLDLATGSLLNTWTVADPNSFISNIFGADWGLDYTVDRIYCGSCIADPFLPGGWGGKIYRLLTKNDEDPLNWEFEMIFDMQRPITAEGSIATDRFNHLWVYFGSGRFFSEIDEYDYTPQRYIGFRDDTTHAKTVLGLFNVTDVRVDTNDVVYYPSGATSTFDALIDTVNTMCGWWRELGNVANPGERNLTTSLVFGGALLFTTYIPTGDICEYGGRGNMHALYFRTGTAYTDPFLSAEDTLYRPTYVDLGQGMPSEPSLYLSADQTKVFIQAGGGIVSPETGIPGLPHSGIILWKAQ